MTARRIRLAPAEDTVRGIRSRSLSSQTNFDSNYNSLLHYNTLAQAAAITDITRSADSTYSYAQSGYLIVGPSGSVIFSGSANVSPTTPMGWADVKDSTGGQGITFGTDFMAAHFPRSLEIRNGGQEIDIGISPNQEFWPNANCSGGITPCQKIYYQPWPYYKIASIDSG